MWQAFEKVSGKPVARMMHNWTAKPGYLVVKLKVESGKLKVSQERFFSSPISAKKAKDKTKWDFPLNFKNGKVNTPLFVIKVSFLALLTPISFALA